MSYSSSKASSGAPNEGQVSADHLVFHRILVDISSEQLVSISDIRYFSLLSDTHQQSIFQLLISLPKGSAVQNKQVDHKFHLNDVASNHSSSALYQNTIKEFTLEEYAIRFIKNNPHTRNLQHLVEIVAGQLNNINRQLNLRKLDSKMEKLVSVDSALHNTTCQGLALLIGLFHHFSMNLKENEWRVQFNISNDWPGNINQIFQMNNNSFPNTSIRHHNLLEYLVDELVYLILHDHLLSQDLQYLAIDLLLVLCSSAVYQKQSQNLVLGYLFRRCGVELQHALHHPSVSVILTECLASRLVQKLTKNAVTTVENLGQNSYLKSMADYWQFYLEELHKLDHINPNKENHGILSSVTSIFSAVWWIAGANSTPPKKDPINHDHNHSSKQDHGKFSQEKARTLSGDYWNERNCQLLLCLIHHRRLSNQQNIHYNPFRDVFHLLFDSTLLNSSNESDNGNDVEELDLEMMMNTSRRGSMTSSESPRSISFDFSQVTQYLIRKLPDKSYLILLYSLLQMNPKFLMILQKQQCVETILLSCLQGLYQSVDKGYVNDHLYDFHGIQLSYIYTSLTCIELFVQESSILQPLLKHSISLAQIPWFKEKMQVNHKMELLDVVVMVMLKAMSYGIFVQRDSYISKTSRGILINLLPSSVNNTLLEQQNNSYILLHPYISERMMRTILLYCKKAIKEYEIAMNKLATSSTEIRSTDNFYATKGTSGEVHGSNPLGKTRVRSESQSSVESHTSHAPRRNYIATQSAEFLDEEANFASAQQDQQEKDSEKIILALREGIITLLEVVSTILRTNILTYIHVLYALILDYENVQKQLNHEFIGGLIEMEGDQAILYRVFILNISKYYRSLIESSLDEQFSNKSKGTLPLTQQDLDHDSSHHHAVGKYFTADQAMTFLRQHVKTLLKCQKLEATKHKIPVSPAWFIFKVFSHPNFRQSMTAEELAQLAYDENVKLDMNQKYHFQEAENPDAFFLPFLWRIVVNSTPHIPWNEGKCLLKDS